MPVRVERVLLASPRGFCAGVEMAIKALAWMVRVFEPPVYCYHEIVHNQVVVDRFRQLGVVFVDDVAEVPPGAPAHALGPWFGPRCGRRPGPMAGAVVDAVCPLVTKVHHEVKLRASKGYAIVYVGHEGHEEAVGTMAVAPECHPPRRKRGRADGPARAGGDPGRVPGPDDPGPRRVAHYPGRRPRSAGPISGSRDAVTFASPPPTARRRCGRSPPGATPWSSSAAPIPPTLSLSCARPSRPAAHGPSRVNTAAELPDDLSGVVGVIAGASAPESLVEEVLRRLAPIEGTEEVRAVPEDEYFPLPRELREVMRGVAALIGAVAFAPPPPAGAPDGPEASVDGRELSAAQVLAALG